MTAALARLAHRLHFDLQVADRSAPVAERMVTVDAEVGRLMTLGATVVRQVAPSVIEYYFVMGDPERSEFCVA
jgi:Glyoxalase-like domain